MGSGPIVGSTIDIRLGRDDRLGKIDRIISQLRNHKTSELYSVLSRNADKWIGELGEIKNTLSRDDLSGDAKTVVEQKLAKIISDIVSPDISAVSRDVGELCASAANAQSQNGPDNPLSSGDKAKFSQGIQNIMDKFQGYGLDHNPLYYGLSKLKDLVTQDKMTYGGSYEAVTDLTRIATAGMAALYGGNPVITR
jgi:hypothetical protein